MNKDLTFIQGQLFLVCSMLAPHDWAKVMFGILAIVFVILSIWRKE